MPLVEEYAQYMRCILAAPWTVKKKERQENYR